MADVSKLGLRRVLRAQGAKEEEMRSVEACLAAAVVAAQVRLIVRLIVRLELVRIAAIIAQTMVTAPHVRHLARRPRL